MAVFDHNQICTSGRSVSVGDQCQYYEEGMVANVEVLDDESNENGIGFRLRVTDALTGPWEAGEEFSCWAAHGHYAYGGMWRLYGPNEYVVLPAKES
jgi:hypothetical protein